MSYRYPIVLSILFLLPVVAFSQNIGVNENGTAPDSSAILDIASNDKGLLVPRLTTTERLAIASPAAGLLVYDTDFNGFWCYEGAWYNLSGGLTDSDADTRVQVEETLGEDIIRFDVDSTEKWIMIGNRLEPSGSDVAIGRSAMGTSTMGDCVAVGDSALQANSSGMENVAVGSGAMRSNTSGDRNLAAGMFALHDNTSGNHNVAVGFIALRDNLGDDNTAVGNFSMAGSTSGHSNTAVGCGSLTDNKTGSENVAIGLDAMRNDSTGSKNVGIGGRALRFNKHGSFNVAVGIDALVNSSGSYNTAIGSETTNGGSFSNSTALGYSAQASASNSMVLGNSSITSICGQVAFTTCSDARFKVRVKEDIPGLDLITRLRPVSYYWDIDAIAEFHHTPDSLRLGSSEALKAKVHESGFIAQEVEAAATAIGYEFNGVDAPASEDDPYGLRYANFVVPLVKAVQEQQDMIVSGEQVIQQQQHSISQMRTQLEQQGQAIEHLQSIIEQAFMAGKQ